MSGVDPHRVAEVIVGDASPRRATGYRVATGAVLTAAHVLAGTDAAVVRFDAGRPECWTRPAVVAWRDDAADLAILIFEPPEDGEPLPPVRYGTIADRAAVLAVEAVGLPRWKLRAGEDGSRYRDVHHARGRTSTVSNRRSGTLEVQLDSVPSADPSPDHSPWEGMSGAALWCNGVVIGVIAEHSARGGLSTLGAVRIDNVLSRPAGDEQRTVSALLGLPDVPSLLDVTPSPDLIGRRADFGVPRPARLVGREEELAELARFCGGGEAYARWVGPPWSGKTALLAAFAAEPPAGVDLVSFFVVARYADQCDSDAFVKAALPQLCALTGDDLPDRSRADRRLLPGLIEAAREKSVRRGRQLVLLVDGLDEDQSTAAGLRIPSIASLLPTTVRTGLQVVVSGRPDPPFPDDVPSDHPVRSARHRLLTPSPAATDIARLARAELKQILAGDPAFRDILGLIVASGGGLSIDELEQLTRLSPFDLSPLSDGTFGRAFLARRDARTGRVDYAVAHETLRLTAIEQLGRQLTGYRERIHAWAAEFRSWPARTPGYFRRAYPRMLLADRRRDLLTELAIDRERHRWLLEATGGDGAAIEEIEAVRDLHMLAADPDLTSLATLAVHHDRLLRRNQDVTAALPRVWARLGELDRAEALAGALGVRMDPGAHAQLAEIALAAGERDRALELLAIARNRMERSIYRDSSHGVVALVAARAGLVDLTVEALDPDQLYRSPMRKIVAGLTAFGGITLAEEFIGKFEQSGQFRLRQELFLHLLDTDVPAAARLARRSPATVEFSAGWERLFQALVHIGQPAEAVELCTTIGPARWAAAPLLQALVAHGDDGEARRFGSAMAADSNASVRAPAEALLHGRTAALAYVAGRHPMQRFHLLVQLVSAGPREDAGAYARAALAEFGEGTGQPGMDGLRLAEAAADAGVFDVAEAAAMKAATQWRSTALVKVAEALAAQGRHAEAARLAQAAADLPEAERRQARRALGMVATQAAQSGDWSAARDALSVLDHNELREPASLAVEFMARRGEAQAVASFVRDCPSQVQVEVVTGLLRGLVAIGRYRDAERWALEHPDDMRRPLLVDRLVGMLADADQPARAERLAARLSEHRQADTYAELAERRWRAGDTPDAVRLAHLAERTARHVGPYLQGWCLYQIAVALIGIGDTRAADQVATRIDHPLVGGRRLACRILAACHDRDLDRVLHLSLQGEPTMATTFADPGYRPTAGPLEVVVDLARALHRSITLLIGAGRQSDAELVVRRTSQEDLHWRALQSLVLQTAKHSDHRRAEELVKLATTAAARAKLAGVVVEEVVAAGEPETGERITRANGAASDHPILLFRLAAAVARRGDRSRGLALLREAESLAGDRGFGWEEPTLVTAYAWVGEDDAARRVADRRQPPDSRAWRALLDAYIDAGRVPDAMALVEDAPSARSRWVLGSAVAALAAAGRLDLAERAAALASDPESVMATIGPLATACAAAGQPGRVAELADRAEEFAGSSAQRTVGGTLATVADAMAQLGETGRARRLLALALTEDRWAEVLGTMARVSPEALHAIAKIA